MISAWLLVSCARHQQADVILGLGVRFDDRVTGKLPDFAPAAKAAAVAGTGVIIHFDILPKNINKVVRPDVAVVGDCKLSLESMMPMIEPNGAPTAPQDRSRAHECLSVPNIHSHARDCRS
jgi:thiamine pyrophosphate-dependent acetolactate synthase large subunit-like protein